ncbi:hypothetical protein YC2023_086919 [Brassica napus]
MLENRDGEDVGREKGGYGEFWIENITKSKTSLFLGNTGEVRRIGGPLDALDLPVVAFCARIWVRSEIRDPPEPLKGRYHHAPASSSRSSRSPLSVRPKEFSTPSVLHFPYAKAPTVRLSVPVVCDVSFVSRDRMGSMLFRLRLTVT